MTTYTLDGGSNFVLDQDKIKAARDLFAGDRAVTVTATDANGWQKSLVVDVSAPAQTRAMADVRDFTDLTINSVLFRTQTPSAYPDYPKPWVLRRYTGTDEFRFELRDGDAWAADASLTPPRNRVEMQQRNSGIPRGGTPFWFTDTYATETDAPAEAVWTDINQVHSSISGVNPILSTEIVGDTFKISTASNPATTISTSTYVTHYYDTAFVRRRYTRLVYYLVPGEAGSLRVWRDGQLIIDIPSLPLGYPNDTRCTPYLKWGQYRRASTQTYAVRHVNVEGLTLDSLEPRVLAPKPLPFGTPLLIGI